MTTNGQRVLNHEHSQLKDKQTSLLYISIGGFFIYYNKSFFDQWYLYGPFITNLDDGDNCPS
jgi:hypothetical protein